MNPNDATASAFCATLHDDFLPWAFVFTVAGFIWSFKDIMTSPFSQVQKAMVLIIEVCIIAALLGGWKALFFDWLESSVVALANQAGAANQFTFMTQVMAKSGQSSQSFFTFDWSRVLYLAIAFGFLKAVSYFAFALQWVMEVFRLFFINCMYAISPLFVPMLIFKPLSSTGHRFILTAASLHFWKIGFVLVDIGSLAMFENAQTGISNTVDAVATMFPIFLASGWIIIGYLGTPFAIRAITQAGSSFAGAMIEGGSSAASGTGVIRAGAGMLSDAGASMAGAFAGRTGSIPGSSTGGRDGASTPPATTSTPPPGPATTAATAAKSLAGDTPPPTTSAPAENATGSNAARAAQAQTQGKIDQMVMQSAGGQSPPSTPPPSPLSVAKAQELNEELFKKKSS